ncbi:UDP-N-acetylmuramate:L-alanyl-gamma-D-glutamyl-meso-diaminopimelate ligase [Thalassotalea ponticola]|uniref:UDP-N-acetylmuramate:L-alanyl-gamma-D-glutamyl- meso-diaminopimelate ligase n=1 Tax=Thalassotalea ponticola TaxID=1523392 RepID=UPI0025B425D4|nr:UDP-N-acetylmuramate:L-alanyl-gamma-D-glutamyl-meso-diaminopimelate ligase [Thalassotalea ponticola]MDN3652059.1 UDP-N-acetylmuramate:L-alanyl-gamma-D-glutamyl-meso-diaminopimelate ligase [Thalassotalea ponticola]
MAQHIHILGVCGTFMGGIAAIAKQLGFRVSGCDANVYPPMSDQLQQLGIELKQGYHIEHLADEPDMVIIGNAMSRGNPMVEYVLERNIAYTSGPQWLLDNVLKDRWVLAVSGTHGKTTTSSMLAWILDYAKLAPGFLIGGVPQNFGQSARLGDSPFFVIEADEYDTAFFDKRSKFVHYRPRTLVINNVEFDHADIFNNIDDIKRQFHHLIRMVPSNGLILTPEDDCAVRQTLEMGCWTNTEFNHCATGWQAKKLEQDGSDFEVYFNGIKQGRVQWQLIGDFNIDNATMAIAAARHAGVPTQVACQALQSFVNTKRRQELLADIDGIRVYDDFAHHPTAIRKNLDAFRQKVGTERILAVLEPRSNTMKSGVHRDTLAASLDAADLVFLYQDEQLQWSVADLVNECKGEAYCQHSIDDLVDVVSRQARAFDHIVVMSNGGFGSFHSKLIDKLKLLKQEV